MGNKTHSYKTEVRWTGNLGRGTETYRGYSRDHEINVTGKLAPIACSSDAAFRGDPERYNPEELFVAALSTCHMLWVLHLCADRGIVITSYEDEAVGTMLEEKDGSGRFTGVTLNPRMTITDPSRRDDALAAHDEAHHMCFLANSVRCPVSHKPEVR